MAAHDSCISSASRLSQQAAARASASSDPCADLDAAIRKSGSSQAGSSFVRPSVVGPCASSLGAWDSPPSYYSQALALQDLDTTILHFQNWYSLLHIAKKSPDRANLPSAYDVVAELQKLKAVKWKSAEDLFQAITEVIARLDDSQTGVLVQQTIPRRFWFPLPLVGVVEGGAPVIRVAPSSLTDGFVSNVSRNAPFKFDPAPFFGAKVLSIAGVDAWKYMLGWANSTPLGYHNLGQKLNAAFARPWQGSDRASFTVGKFAGRVLSPKEGDSLRMVLLRSRATKSQTVDVPFIAVVDTTGFPFSPRASASASASARQASLAASGTTTTSSTTSSSGSSSSSGIEGGALPLRSPLTSQRAATPGTQASTIISAPDDLWPVHLLPDNKTAVVVVPSFKEPPTSTPDATFLNGSAKALDLAAKYASQVIIDVSDNPGGEVRFARWLEQLLVGTWYFTKPPGRLVISDYAFFRADTDLVKELVKLGSPLFLAYSQYWKPDETPYTAKTKGKFFFPVKSLTFGAAGVRGTYSSTFKSPSMPLAKLGARPPALNGKPFALLSNGLCYGACASFLSAMRLRYNVPLVTVGGGGVSSLAPSAGGGGLVSRNVDSDFTAQIPAGVRSSGVPNPYNYLWLQLKVASAFHSPASTIPIDFTFLKADLSISYTLSNINNFPAVYREAATYFTKKLTLGQQAADPSSIIVSLLDPSGH